MGAYAERGSTAADPSRDVEQPPRQGEMPFAIVQGTPLLTLPLDLYIPPDALEVFLDAFEGPLDLLLYLITRQNLDILEIPVAAITDQYMAYIEIMAELRPTGTRESREEAGAGPRRLDLAAEYLVMAAMLAEIKSRMLLPRPAAQEEDEEDPRAELIRRLQEYERFKHAAQELDALPRLDRDHFLTQAQAPPGHSRRLPPAVDLREVLLALREVLARADLYTRHRVEKEALSLRERMSLVLERLASGDFLPFTDLFPCDEGRAGVVVTFLAILELTRGASLELVQAEPFAPIHVRLRLAARDGGHAGDSRDGGGRAASGTAAEDARPESLLHSGHVPHPCGPGAVTGEGAGLRRNALRVLDPESAEWDPT
jgi:segregation and condensation protein A